MSKLFFDTSILVAALVEGHPRHRLALPWLQQVVQGEAEGLIGVHTLAELYAVLTALPVRPALTTAVVQQLIQHNIVAHFTLIDLKRDAYLSLIDELAPLGIRGGAVYDGLLMQAAELSGAEKILTLNAPDFRRVKPKLAGLVVDLL